MKPIEYYLGPSDYSKIVKPVYRGWESGMHRLPQTTQGDGIYTIDYHGIKYSYPQSLAEKLEQFHVTDEESGRLSYPLVSKWYEQLSDEEKAMVQKSNHH